jgi:uncharacterized UBP type Zn finger protein
MPTGDVFRIQFWSQGRQEEECSHLGQYTDVVPGSDGCEECLAMGDTWVHRRLCMTCDHVGCCDDSKNKHASKHYQAMDHPLVTPMEAGQEWLWCYADRIMVPIRSVKD